MTLFLDVAWGPMIGVIYAIKYWPVVLLVVAVIVITIILIKKLKK